MTNDEARAARIFGAWTPDDEHKARAAAGRKGIRAPLQRALFARTSGTTGKQYLCRGWVAHVISDSTCHGLLISRGGKVIVGAAGVYGAQWFQPADVPGSDGPGCDQPAPQTYTGGPRSRHHSAPGNTAAPGLSPFGTGRGANIPPAAPSQPFAATPAPAPSTTDESETDDDEQTEAEPGTFGRLLKGYKLGPAAPQPALTKVNSVPSQVPGVELNHVQAALAKRWLDRSNGSTMADFARAAVSHYLAHIQDEEI